MPTDPAELPEDWWTADDAAGFLGIARATWTAYVHRGHAPPPARLIGRTPVWLPNVVRDWHEHRRGPGRWGPRESPPTTPS